MARPTFLALSDYQEYPVEVMKQRAAAFCDSMRTRRTVCHFDRRAVPREAIEACLRAAGSAQTGANLQPWHFVVVSDPEIKQDSCRGRNATSTGALKLRCKACAVISAAKRNENARSGDEGI
jgi:nitroreductase